MLNRTYFTERPTERRIVRLPDGCADVWIRQNIVEVTDEETGEVHFEADEAYMRLPEGFDPEAVTFEEIAGMDATEEHDLPRFTVGQRLAYLEGAGVLGRDGDGLYYPADCKPDSIERGSLLLGEARREIIGKQSLACSVGLNITLAAEAPKGATEYRIANNYNNRITAQIIDGSAVCLDKDSTRDTVRVINVRHEDGTYVVPGSPSGDHGQIIITTEATANRHKPTSTLRIYPRKAGFGNVFVGAAGSSSGTAGYSIVGGQGVRNDANASLVVGNAIYNAGSSSLVTGRNQINHKQNALLAGEGHDTTDARDGVAAVGKYSKLDADTAFAVGNGTGGTKRKNAFEIKTDGTMIATLKSPNGSLYKLSVDDDGTLITTKA